MEHIHGGDMAKAIMIQGTMSNAGKSLFAAGLCRVFHQDGYRVAPFKSQNMALNSYITKEGLEMGRAQVVQAEAAGIAPCVDMNPILLKPTNDTGSQVIVQGKVVGNMRAMDYFKRKRSYVPTIMESYHRLAKAYDIIVLEGAGSPAEINLKQHDIVNMGMAKLAKAPVLLVGDIDRGGVFAQLYGTMELLEKDEQALVKGLLINKFRGDKDILMPGITMLQEKCGREVLGVVPYLHVDIDDEDSLTERFYRKETGRAVDIAVIRLPRISNFTDFNVFSYFEEVSVRYVATPEALGSPDMVILPGSKNTIEDLLWLRQSGLEAKILQLAKRDVIVFGVCGGYQMLGETITDASGIEHQGSVRGMGLLPVHTHFQEEKTRTRVQGTFGAVGGTLAPLGGMALEGYEIHMGTSTFAKEVQEKPLTNLCEEWTVPQAQKTAGKLDGAQKGNVYGSYVHGIFDAPEVAKTIVAALLEKKGISAGQVETLDVAAYKEQQYDLLADAIRQSVDMDKIYAILEQGIA